MECLSYMPLEFCYSLIVDLHTFSLDSKPPTQGNEIMFHMFSEQTASLRPLKYPMQISSWTLAYFGIFIHL